MPVLDPREEGAATGDPVATKEVVVTVEEGAEAEIAILRHPIAAIQKCLRLQKECEEAIGKIWIEPQLFYVLD